MIFESRNSKTKVVKLKFIALYVASRDSVFKRKGVKISLKPSLNVYLEIKYLKTIPIPMCVCSHGFFVLGPK